MRRSKWLSHTGRITLQAAIWSLAVGCTTLGSSLAPALLGVDGNPRLPESTMMGSLEDALGRHPFGRRHPIPAPMPERARGSATRTDAEPLPLPSALKLPSVGLNSENGAVVGALLGLSGGLLYEAPLGCRLNPGERAASVLGLGALGAVGGAFIGSLGGDPTGLLWPLEVAGVLPDPVFRPLFPRGRGHRGIRGL